MNAHTEQFEAAARGAVSERARGMRLHLQLLALLAALFVTSLSLRAPAVPAGFLALQPALLAVLWWALGDVEPALIVGAATWSGALWSARLHGLVGEEVDERWTMLGVLAGGTLATCLVHARLALFRARRSRAAEILARTAALTAVLLAATFLVRGQPVHAATLLPALSAVLVAPVGMNVLFLRGRASGAPHLIDLLGGLWAIAFLVGNQVLLFVVVEPFLRLVGQERARRQARLRSLARRGMGALYQRFPLGRAEIVDATPARFARPSVIVSNHQSAVDIPILLSLPADVRLTLKKRVWDAPYMGIGARRLGHVLVEPEHPEKTLERCRAVMAEGASVAFFPEGTRGTDIYPRRFHRGAFDVAVELGCDVIPVVLCETRTCIPRDAFWVEPFHLVVKVLPPVTPADFDHGAGSRELMRHVQALIRDELVQEMRRLTTDVGLRRKVRRHYRYLGRAVARRVNAALESPALRRLSAAALPEEGLLLELGCGHGVRANWLREKHPRLCIHGFDSDEDAIRIARLTAAGTERLAFSAGAPRDWRLPPASAALFAGRDLGRLAEVLPKLAESLPRGGKLLLTELGDEAREPCRRAGFRTLREGLYERGPRA